MCNGKSEKSEIMDKLSVVLVTNKGLCDTNVICFVCCRNIKTVAACWEVHTDEIRSKIPVNFALNQNVDTQYCQTIFPQKERIVILGIDGLVIMGKSESKQAIAALMNHCFSALYSPFFHCFSLEACEACLGLKCHCKDQLRFGIVLNAFTVYLFLSPLVWQHVPVCSPHPECGSHDGLSCQHCL